jgi:hypothetical protein
MCSACGWDYEEESEEDVKVYLGDGVYADVEYGALVLTTEDGIQVTNRIVLEQEVYNALVRYMAGLRVLHAAAEGQR